MALVLDGDNGIVGVLATNADGDVIIDTSTFFVDADLNRVGIGTTTPNTSLHISAGSSGGSLTNAFEITDSGYTNIQMLSGGADGEIKIGAAGQLRGSYKAQYAGTSGSHNFNIGTNATNAITIDTSQRVGIGHTSPDEVLDVKGNFTLRDTTGNLAHGMSVFGDDDQYAIFNQEASGDGGLRITTLSDATSAASAFQINAVATTPSTDGNNAAIRLRAAKKNGTTEQALASTEDVLSIGNTGTELVIVKGNGNIGIGTQSPDRALHIEGSDFSSSTIRLKRTGGGTNNDAGLQFTSAAGANADTGMGGIWFQNSLDGNAYALIRARTDDATGTSGRLDFMTSTSLVDNNTSPSLTIKANGNVGIGTTNPGYKFEVAGKGHVRGLISNPTAYGGNSGSGTKGSTTLGAGKYWDTSYSTGYMHIVLPSRYNSGNSKMFFLEVKGYDFNRPGLIDLKYGGYVTPVSNGGPISRAVVLDNYGGYSPAVYYSSNYGAGVCRFYWPSGVYYGSFTINTIASGNGDVIEPDELQIILSSSSTI